MTSTKELPPPQWERYRALIDETSALEHEIIGILSTAICRREGNGEPNEIEQSRIAEMKAALKSKIKELKFLEPVVSLFLDQVRHTEPDHQDNFAG